MTAVADRLGVGEVDLVPVGAATGPLDRLDRVECRTAPLDPCEIALDELRRRPLAALANPIRQFARQAVAVARKPRQIGVVTIRLGDEVERDGRCRRMRRRDR